MRFRIEAQPATPGWRLIATNLEKKWDGDKDQPPFVRPVGVPAGKAEIPVPIPPENDRLPPTGNADIDGLYSKLCAATDSEELNKLLASFTIKSLKAREAEALGRYLFSALIGEHLWAEIKNAAASEWIDLVLVLPADSAALTRLPWELMRNSDGFIAEQPRVSMVREVAGTVGSLPQLARAPRVLFVVGTQIDNDVIRPGAEYLQLARVLRSKQLDLKTSLVLDASADRVAASIDEFEPDVVHFICHGAIDSKGVAYLTLIDDSDVNRRKPARAVASDVITMLRGKKDATRRLPRMVVLSACYTAASKVVKFEHVAATDVVRVGQVATPLAAQLVAAKETGTANEIGAAIVVAMSGPIADQACRLFTRQFYESLAREQDIARATAIGRLAAIRGDDRETRQSVEWAFPAIFVAGGITGATLAVERNEIDKKRTARWNRLREAWPYAEPALFCDRFSVLERFDLLMADPATPKALTGKERRIEVLAIEVPAKDQELDPVGGKPPEKFGRSELLHELAAKAYADGHLPILISEKLRARAPKTVDELLDRINTKVQTVLGRMELAGRRLNALDWVYTLPDGKVGEPAPFVPADLQYDVLHPPKVNPTIAIQGKALRFDLTRLLSEMRQECRPSDEGKRCRLVVLIDDLHLIEGESAGHVLDYVIGGNGLALAADDVRVVFTWASRPAEGQQTAVNAIEAWVAALPEFSKITIQRFGQRFGSVPLPGDPAGDFPLEERLTYEFFLLMKRGLVARRAQLGELAMNLFWRTCKNHAEGVPSRLDSGVAKALDTFREEGATDILFQEADDDKRLEMARAQER